MATKTSKRARRPSEREKLLHSLKAHKQVQAPSGKGEAKALPSGVTHTIETRPDGTKVLVRKRFSAV
jgi:hypothetical protein